MCNTSNSPSLKERVQCYVRKRYEIEAEYKSKIKALNEEASADILANCPIKIGDVYVTESNTARGLKRQYYKIAKVYATVDGRVSVYGSKRKLDKTWSKRDNMYMFSASIYDNYNVNNYDKVEDYAEPSKD
jgi:hypothetical protein